MRVIIDLDSHSAIQDFGNRSAPPPYQFKSQDTVEWELYFVQNGIVQDLGAGFALKFGMIKTGDASNTLLAYQTAFTYKTDTAGNVYYSGLVNFNTSQMASAIGTLPSIQGTGEIRYQDSLNEIIHTINISTVVYATIIVETGVTPPNVSTGYPDASAIELLVHKNVAGGYAGLSAVGSGYISNTHVLVDGETIGVNANGQLGSAAILATVTANFTTPAANVNVTVTVDSTINLKASSYVRIPIAGYYIVKSITDSTHVALQNNADPFNAVSGTTITAGAVLLPAQAAAGGGSAGQPAYTNTTAAFTVPAVGATVSVAMTATSWLAGSGYVVFITGAGFYAVSSITDANHAVLTNLGYTATNATPGTNIASDAQISPGGLQGPSVTGAPGANAYDTTQASFTMPAAGVSVSVQINNTGWLATGQEVFVAGAGYFSVAAITSATIFSATNSNYPGAATPGSTIASGAKVTPAGVMGAQGAGGAGLNAFTTLTSNFIQPAVNATVAIVVGTTAWMAIAQGIYIQGGGYYTVNSIADLTHVTVSNLGSTGNAAPGATVTGSGTQNISPAGVPGQAGVSSYTTTTANFTMPASGATVTIALVTTAFIQQNQNIFVSGAGYFVIASIIDAIHVAATNLGATGNVSSGTSIPSGSGVTTAGAIGPTGAVGPSGPTGGIGEAPTDGQLYGRQSSAWAVVPSGGGGGGAFDPKNGQYWYDDFISWYTTPFYGSNLGGSGGAITATAYGQDAIRKFLGNLELSTGTGTTTAACAIAVYGITTSVAPIGGIYPGLGAITLRWRCAIPASLPGTGISYFARLGFITGPASAALSSSWANAANYTQQAFFEYSPDQNSGQWRVATGTTTSNYLNTSVAVAADTVYNLEVDINAPANTYTFLINGTTVATVTTGLPNSLLYPTALITRSLSNTTNWKLELDYLYLLNAVSR